MAFTKIVLVLVCLMSTTLVAQEAKVAPLMSKDLAECPGKEGVMITVEYPPGLQTKYIGTRPMCLFMCWKARSRCRSEAERKRL
jgi:hypothetical protein